MIQGRTLGSTTLTVQASGYDDGTSGVNVTPAGFRLVGTTSSDFTITAGAANRAIQLRPSAWIRPRCSASNRRLCGAA